MNQLAVPENAKAAYTTRHLRFETIDGIITEGRPVAGDLVLARVAEIGQHQRLELCDGRRATLYEGDPIIVTYANRYAPDQFEAVVPDDLGPCHLAAAGGVAAQTLSQHAAMLNPTCLEPVGLLSDASGRRVNLRDWRLPDPSVTSPSPHTIVVVGTAMNAGKTTAAAGIIRGLTLAGCRVGAAKITGTGAGGDVWLMTDAGATPVLDFTAAGFASTYRCTDDEVLDSLRILHGHLASTEPDVIVLEIADGLLQRETAALLATCEMREVADAFVFAAGDAMGAVNGVAALRALGLPVVAVSGLLTASPLATREARDALDVPVFTLEELFAAPASIRPSARTHLVSAAR
ncbi:MAG: DUF1611 domain-containing protein [Actinomycetota bacterium]|nr:DUF1611 domain-containing protein [Actinomycetota bacterium]